MTYDTAKRIFNGYKFQDVMRVTLKRRERYVIYTAENGFFADVFQLKTGDESTSYIRIRSSRLKPAIFEAPLAQVAHIRVNSDDDKYYIEIQMKNGSSMMFIQKLEPKGETT